MRVFAAEGEMKHFDRGYILFDRRMFGCGVEARGSGHFKAGSETAERAALQSEATVLWDG